MPARRPTCSRGCRARRSIATGDLRLQYLAGMALNVSMEGAIYSEMLKYKRYPSNLFTGSEQTLQQLQAAITAVPK